MIEENQATQQGVEGLVTPRNQCPKAPPSGYAKIHVDTGVRLGRGGSASAVCRDSAVTFFSSSTLVIVGVDDPATLEAIACREGIALAQDLRLQNFVIASD